MAKKPANKNEIIFPSVLSFSRALEPTDGFFYQKNSADSNGEIKPVVNSKQSLRTTMCNRQKPAIMKNPDAMNAEVAKPNLQLTENAYLDEDCDTLIANFSIKVLPFTDTPAACNSDSFLAVFQEALGKYKQDSGFDELARRYATNLANARWLWRTRFVSRSITTTIKCVINGETKVFVFDSKKLPLDNLEVDNADIQELGKLIASALRDEFFLILYVTAEADIGYGHQVFPSEEMSLDKDYKGKRLFERSGVAGLHAVKIGNAIRTIDTWYPSDITPPKPISIEVFGSVISFGKAYRQPYNNSDFYTIFDNWMEQGIEPDDEQKHYVMAVLIRGGIFGKSSKG